MNKRGRPPHPDILTPREWEVLELIREKLSNEEIAGRLGISIDGVKYHVSEILGKLGVRNRREAARWQPEGVRASWATAAAPLLFWRRVSLGWLSLALAGGLAIVVAAGIGLLVWALVVTRGEGETQVQRSGPLQAAGTPIPTPTPAPGLIFDRPSPDFRGMDFVSDEEGWLLAGGGLLHTTDGGETWTEAARVIGQEIDFADEDHGWIVGEAGTIYATADGETWVEQESGTNVHLSDIYAVNAWEAWAVGDGEGYSDAISYPLPTVLLHTTDAGASWQQVETPPCTWFSRITFLEDNGWVAGSQLHSSDVGTESDRSQDCVGQTTGAILATSDGGEKWSLLDTDLPRYLVDMVFAGEDQGWVSGRCYYSPECWPGLYGTSDGGRTWERADTGRFTAFDAVAFRDEATGWALATECSDEGRCPLTLLGTTDGGATWNSVRVIDDEAVSSLCSTNRALYLRGRAALLRSGDGGPTLAPVEHPALVLGELTFGDARVGYSVGSGGLPVDTGDLLRTEDGGGTWHTVGPEPGNRPVLDFIDARHGFAASWELSAGENALVVRETTDGGEGWRTISSFPPPANSYGSIGLDFVDENHGLIVVGESLFVTEDGGETWAQSFYAEAGEALVSVEPAGTSGIWIVVERGNRHHLIYSTDFGGSWTETPKLGGLAPRLEFVDGLHGWAVSGDRLVRTSDGGVTWQELDYGGGVIEGLLFADPLHGWLSVRRQPEDSWSYESERVLLRTADGGDTWTEHPFAVPYAGNLVLLDSQSVLLQPMEQHPGLAPPTNTIEGRTLLYRIE